MTPAEGNPLPSRRALREQQRNTEAITLPGATAQAPTEQGEREAAATPVADFPIPTHYPTQPVASAPPAQATPVPPQESLSSPPLTRRQRREQEQQIATGAIALPPEVQPAPPAPESSASPVVPPPVTPPQEVSGQATGQMPGVAAGSLSATAPHQNTAHNRLLTRRERREMEQRGEPVPDTGRIPVLPDQGGAEGAGGSILPGSGGASPPVSMGTLAANVGSADAPGVGASEPAPLPPVFGGPTIVQPDSLTAPARTVGAGLNATHALILPVAPSVDVTGPIGDTGEVLITGNIPLPRHVSEQALTGALEMEEDTSPYDQADGSSFTTPIRATDAVSSRTIQVGQPMIQRPRWGIASIVLGSSAAILGVTALGLLALALLTDIVELPF
jgi:hypothetical protein